MSQFVFGTASGASGSSGDSVTGAKGAVTTAGDTTFAITSLSGLGDDYFADWTARVIQVTDDDTSAPHGEERLVTSYTSATGSFTVNSAYSATTEIGDIVQFISPPISVLDNVFTHESTFSLNVAASTETTVVTWNTSENSVDFGRIQFEDSEAAGASVWTIRFYQRIAGTEVLADQRTHTVGTDDPTVRIVDGGYLTHERIRITIETDEDTSGGGAIGIDVSATAINYQASITPFA